MSRLQLFGRPFVVFDPKNKDHRRYYHRFHATGSWGHCPFRFVVDEDRGDMIVVIQRQILDYYTDKEFGKPNG